MCVGLPACCGIRVEAKGQLTEGQLLSAILWFPGNWTPVTMLGTRSLTCRAISPAPSSTTLNLSSIMFIGHRQNEAEILCRNVTWMTCGPLPELVHLSISNQLLNNKPLNLAYNNQGLFEPRVPFLKIRSESTDQVVELIPVAAPTPGTIYPH